MLSNSTTEGSEVTFKEGSVVTFKEGSEVTFKEGSEVTFNSDEGAAVRVLDAKL